MALEFVFSIKGGAEKKMGITCNVMRATWKALKNTSEINRQLHKGTLRLHVYHIKGKIIKESPFNATTNSDQLNTVSFS